MTDWNTIARHIGRITGRPFKPDPPRHVGGGCINTAYLLGDDREGYFIKINDHSLADMFEAESLGLEELASSASIRVPKPLCYGVANRQAYLVLEYVDMGGPANPALAGRQLARMHRTTAPRFGWSRDNTIGSTPQPNDWSENWVLFWRDRRLGFQLALAAEKGYSGKLQRRGEKLLELFPPLLDHAPQPSLTHGDLWGGNLSYDREGNPVIYDPAVYYGDRETDLAMTELFGGFGARFYGAYQEVWPLDPGYSDRRTLYNLYHILNHLNLFGGGYLGQAIGMIDRLLAELGH